MVNAYAPVVMTRQVARLRDELVSRGVKISVKQNNIFPTAIRGGDIALKNFDCDFCLYLDKDKYVARMLEDRDIRLFNRADAIEKCDDKMTTLIELAGSVPVPDTLPGLLCYYDDAVVPKHVLDDVQSRLGYPVIIKESYGSLGKGVYKADNRLELEEVANRLKNIPHLFQKYIAQSHGKDMRVIVIGGEVVGGIIRSSDSDFRSNIGLGGKAQKTDVPHDIADMAVKASDILGLDYCGIDFLLSSTPLLCEVNSNAYFDGFEAATGINVAGLYAEHILHVMKNR